VLTPVSSLSGAAQITGRAFPMTFFAPFSVGTFTKGLGFEVLAGTALAVFVPVLTLISLMLLRKRER
jgi:ribosome-dependent ATPase